MANVHKAIAEFLLDNNVPVLQVYGNSMYPLLSNEQKIRVLPLQQPLKLGKCYIFIYNGILRIHRLLKTKNGKAFFIGDSSQKLDSVPISAVIAELESEQNLFFIFILRYINFFFEKIITIFPQCARLRVKIVRSINKCERFFYEREI